MSQNQAGRFRRPAMLDPRKAEEISGGLDPAVQSEIAHISAQALVDRLRQGEDSQAFEHVLSLVEEEGIEIVADMWSHSPAGTLPGALWRLFILREWIRQDAHMIAERYSLGVSRAEVSDAIAGVAKPPGQEEVKALADDVFSGVFSGDLAVALERAAAFCRVVATGSALDADLVEEHDTGRAATLTMRAGSLVGTAEDLERAAALWRAGALD